MVVAIALLPKTANVAGHPMRFKSRVFFLALLTLVCGILQAYFGVGWPLYLFAGTIFIFLLVILPYFRRTRDWAQMPNQAPPPNVGAFEELIQPIYRYIRQQQRHINALEYTSSKILSAAQALPAAAITLTPDFSIEWCNHLSKKLLGIDAQRDIGFNIFNILRLPEFYDFAHSGDWSKPLVAEMQRNNKTYVFRFEMTPHSDRGYLLLCQDISHIEKLRTAQQDFVANVSHELRTPLTVLIGFLETINDLPNDALSPEQLEHYTQLMREQAQRMQAIVSDLLTLSALESTQLSGGETIALSTLITQARRQAETLSKQQHQFEFEVDVALSIFGNGNELLSAITNLMINAVRYTPAGGTIRVAWRKDKKGQAIFSVTDTGLGVAAKDIPRLTERFYRVDKSRSRASGGTGLGLAITKHIVLRHNATLDIQSKLNQGSTFSIIFPEDMVI